MSKILKLIGIIWRNIKLMNISALVASIGRTQADKMVDRYEQQRKIVNNPEKFLSYKLN